MKKKTLLSVMIAIKAMSMTASAAIEAPRYVSGLLPASGEIGSLSVQCRPSMAKAQLQCQFTKLSISVPDRKAAQQFAKDEFLELKKMNKVENYAKSLCEATFADVSPTENAQSKATKAFEKRRSRLCHCQTKECKENQLLDFLRGNQMACRIQMNQFQVAFEGVSPQTWEYHSKDPGPCGVQVDTVLKLEGGVATSFRESTSRTKEGAACEMFPKSQTLLYDQKNLGRYTSSCTELSLHN